MEDRRLLAGAAQVDITPKMGTHLEGDLGRSRPAEILVDPLFAKALVLDDSERRMCIVTLDLTVAPAKRCDEIRTGARERFGLDPDAVMVHLMQNHAAPSLGHADLSLDPEFIPPGLPWLVNTSDEFTRFAVERSLEAIGRALGNLQPVRVGIASGVENRVSFNRRFVMRDGSGEMGLGDHPATDVAYNEGPIDPELGVVSFTTESLRPVAFLLHHTCNVVHDFPLRCVTADWPGAWSSRIRARYGDYCVPLVINGCCANIHHGDFLGDHEINTTERMGATLAEATLPVLKRLVYQNDSRLAYANRVIRIPLRKVPEHELAKAKALLEEHPATMWKEGEEGTAALWEWMYAVSKLNLDNMIQKDPKFDFGIQVLKIGDFALVGLYGTVFVEAQLRLKMKSPAARTFVASNANGYAGYVPTPQALARGGYETVTGTNSKLVPEALDMIVDSSVGLLNSVFA